MNLRTIDTLGEAKGNEVLLYNKNWKLRSMQTCTLKEGKPFVLGQHFYMEYDPATHWSELPDTEDIS